MEATPLGQSGAACWLALHEPGDPFSDAWVVFQGAIAPVMISDTATANTLVHSSGMRFMFAILTALSHFHVYVFWGKRHNKKKNSIIHYIALMCLCGFLSQNNVMIRKYSMWKIYNSLNRDENTEEQQILCHPTFWWVFWAICGLSHLNRKREIHLDIPRYHIIHG